MQQRWKECIAGQFRLSQRKLYETIDSQSARKDSNGKRKMIIIL